MFIIRCLYLFVLLFNLAVFADEGLDQAQHVAIESRAWPDQQVKLRNLIDALQDYTQPSSIKSSIAAFLKDRFGLDVVESRIIDLKETSMRGKSHDLVFFINGEGNQPIYVVKAFQEPTASNSHFLPELSAMAFIQKGGFTFLHTAEPLALSKCHFNSFDYVLLVESVAPGKRLVDYIYAVSAQPEKSPERKVALEQLKQAMASAGKGFGELVKASPRRRGMFPQEQIEKLDSRLNKYLNSPTAQFYQDLLPFEELINYIKSLLKQARDMEHYYVYSHGDAHSRNCLYDSERDIFTLIDLGRLHESMDGDGTPWGHVGYDFMRFLEDMQMKSVGLLTAEEVQQMQQAFIDDYGLTAGSLPSAMNQEFYAVYRLLTRLEQYADYIDILDPVQREERYKVFMYALGQLATRMHKIKS